MKQWNNVKLHGNHVALRSVTMFQLPIRSVGVQGDERTYAHPVLIVLPPFRGELERGSWWEYIRCISPQITNTNRDINRVLFLVSGDANKIPISTVKQAYVTKERLDFLRKIDAIVRKHTFRDTSCNHIWQFPVVLVPFGHHHRESVVLRPVESQDAMTVSFAELPDGVLTDIKNDVENLDAIDFIFYDITNKPPGTIEWE